MQDINTLKQAVEAAEAEYKAALTGHKAAKRYDAVANEGGEGYSTSETLSEAAYNKHMPIISAAKDALFAATWTREVFDARRADWSARVIKTKSYAQLAALEKQVGYTFVDLKKAKELHGL